MPIALRRSVLVLASVCVWPALARAQGETDVAAQFFETGAAAAKRGEYRVCAEAFTEAYKRAPHGATLYNAALCWDGAKDRARAANDYAHALELGGLSDAQAKQAKKSLSELRTALGKLEVREPKGARATAGPLDQATIPFETFVEPGDVDLKLEGPDGELVTQTFSVEAGQHKLVKLELPGKEAKEKPRSKPKASGTPDPDSTSADLQRTAGWILVGASVAAAGVGVGYYVSALGYKDKFTDSGNEDAGARDTAIDHYSVARALWIGAGISAGAGVALVLTAPKRASSARSRGRLEVAIVPNGAWARYGF